MDTREPTVAVADVGPLYKVTGPNGECLNGGSGTWPLPQGDAPGAWWEVAGPVSACRNGLHLASRAQLPQWLPNPGTAFRVWRAEVRDPEVVDAGGKYVAAAARLLPADPAVLRRLSRAQARYAAAVKRADRDRDRALRAAAALPGPSDAWLAYLAHSDNSHAPVPAPVAGPLAAALARKTAEAAAWAAHLAARNRAGKAYAKAVYAAVADL